MPDSLRHRWFSKETTIAKKLAGALGRRPKKCVRSVAVGVIQFGERERERERE